MSLGCYAAAEPSAGRFLPVGTFTQLGGVSGSEFHLANMGWMNKQNEENEQTQLCSRLFHSHAVE